MCTFAFIFCVTRCFLRLDMSCKLCILPSDIAAECCPVWQRLVAGVTSAQFDLLWISTTNITGLVPLKVPGLAPKPRVYILWKTFEYTHVGTKEEIPHSVREEKQVKVKKLRRVEFSQELYSHGISASTNFYKPKTWKSCTLLKSSTIPCSRTSYVTSPGSVSPAHSGLKRKQETFGD